MGIEYDSQDSIQWRMPYVIRESEGQSEETLRQELEQAGAEFLYTSHTEKNGDEPVHEIHVMWRSKVAFERYYVYRTLKRMLSSEEGAYLTDVYQVPVQLPPSVTKALTQAVEYYGKGLEVLVMPVSQEVLNGSE